MTHATFSLLDWFNSNFGSESYSFIELDDLSYFYPADMDVEIPIESGYYLYSYEDIDLTDCPKSPTYRLFVQDCNIVVWKLE